MKNLGFFKNIIVCAQSKLFLSFSLYVSLTIKCKSLYINLKVVSKTGCHLVSHSRIFWYFSHTVYSICGSSSIHGCDHPHHILDPTIHYIEECCSINKQSSTDSFLDCGKVIPRFSSHSLQSKVHCIVSFWEENLDYFFFKFKNMLS